MLTFDLEGGSRIIARPSGTEPKIKFYFDLREPMEEGKPLSRADARLREFTAAFSQIAGVTSRAADRTCRGRTSRGR